MRPDFETRAHKSSPVGPTSTEDRTDVLSDKYEDDEEVMDFMRRLEAISKRQA